MAISATIYMVGAAAIVSATIFFPMFVAPLALIPLLSSIAFLLFDDADFRSTCLYDHDLRQELTVGIRDNPELCHDIKFWTLGSIVCNKDADVEMLLKNELACKAFAIALKDETHPIHKLARKMYDGFGDLRLRAILAGKSPSDVAAMKSELLESEDIA
jgi:hypothetical protein